MRQLGEQFQKEYGIAVEVLDGRASEIRERIRTEQAAGRAIGDLIYSGATSIALQTAEGAFKPHGPLPLAGNLAEPFTSNGTFLPSSAGNFALLINTNLVKEDIKSWKDSREPQMGRQDPERRPARAGRRPSLVRGDLPHVRA